MTADAADGTPTLGEVFYKTWLPLAYDTCDTSPLDRRDPRDRDAIEAGAADVGAAAIARLDTPAKLCAAMTENVRLRKELHERDAQLADALTPTAGDFDHAAEIMRLRGLIDELLDSTGLDDGEKAEWLSRASIDLEDE